MLRLHERPSELKPLSAEAAIAAARAFIDAFNAQDHERIAASLNYSHIRHARSFQRTESAAEFVAMSRRGEGALAKEGWHHSVVDHIEPVQVRPDKVHLAITVARCRADGEVYNTFETFWIATRLDGHWGIQFRSSFLR